MDDLLDIYNDHGWRIGMALRSQCHGNPKLLHHTSHVVVFHPDGGKILLQKRSMDKDIQHYRKNTGQGSGKRAVVEKSFHSCRHWYASFCAEQGIPPQTVQQNLGHSSSAMTHYYTHTTDAMRQQVREVMDKAKDILFSTETTEPAALMLSCFESNEPESIQPELF